MFIIWDLICFCCCCILDKIGLIFLIIFSVIFVSFIRFFVFRCCFICWCSLLSILFRCWVLCRVICWFDLCIVLMVVFSSCKYFFLLLRLEIDEVKWVFRVIVKLWLVCVYFCIKLISFVGFIWLSIILVVRCWGLFVAFFFCLCFFFCCCCFWCICSKVLVRCL